MRMRGYWLGMAIVLVTGAAYAQGVMGGLVIEGHGGAYGVPGAPYSADVTNETTRTLEDGTRIHQETYGKEYRDSQGRTRREIELAFPSGTEHVRHIVITDPVQRTITMLDPRTKTARVHKFPEIRPPDSQATQTMPATPVPPQRRMAVKSEPLGTKEMEGLTVTGNRVTMTIPEGEAGNDRPIVTTHESWHSNELHISISSVNDDPRWGHMTTQLTNIQREEPDPSLFQVPPDFEVIDENRN